MSRKRLVGFVFVCALLIGAPARQRHRNGRLEDTWIVDAKRVPSKLTGYCYGNQRLNIDVTSYYMSGEELYDMGGKLWKLL